MLYFRSGDSRLCRDRGPAGVRFSARLARVVPSGGSEEQALETLAAYASRYAEVLNDAGVPFEVGNAEFDVVERVPGNVTTDVGAPAVVAAAESEPLDGVGGQRIASVVASCWPFLDRVARQAPAVLRKGPRGGGRDRDEIVDHVAAAELLTPARSGSVSVPTSGRFAPPWSRFSGHHPTGVPLSRRAGRRVHAARRIAWHVLDHAWEIEDKSRRYAPSGGVDVDPGGRTDASSRPPAPT